MDAPPVRYVTTRDGVNIAYSVVGSGFPLVLADSFTTAGIDFRFRSSRTAAFHEALSQSRQVVTFDWRNSGLSGATETFSLQQYVNDIEEVVNQLGLRRFDLWASLGPCKVAMEFALRHQPNVRKLILSHPTPMGSSPRTYYGEAIFSLLAADWEAFTEVFALRLYGWTEAGRDFMDQLRKNWTQESFSAFMAVLEEYNPAVHAGALACETLIIADTAGRKVDVEEARRLAAIIRHGRLVLTNVGGALSDVYNPNLINIAADFFGAADESDELGEIQTATEGDPRASLSLREVEVLRLVGGGKSNQQIAEALVISVNTVIRHVSNIYAKTGAANRAEATAYAARQGLI